MKIKGHMSVIPEYSDNKDRLNYLNDFNSSKTMYNTFNNHAASVSFDSPLDQAVEINLLGPVRIANTLNDLKIAPHLVAVSTCYVVCKIFSKKELDSTMQN